ncbi:MAG: nucleotide pyrophosphohydrolase [Candidatus Helarchaeota archaeon]
MKSLNEIAKEVDEWINQFEEGYWPPLSMLASVVEEVGELAREINSLEKYKKKKNDINEIERISEELGDLLFSVICIANYYEINLEKAFEKIIKKYDERDKHRWTKKKKD